MRPLVTVIVPARNEKRCIEACVASIHAQSVDGELEVVVVDGRSSDRTAALARRAGATVIDNPERITPTALNRGLAAARGRFVARLDAHSEMGPGYLRACLTALDEEAGAATSAAGQMCVEPARGRPPSEVRCSPGLGQATPNCGESLHLTRAGRMSRRSPSDAFGRWRCARPGAGTKRSFAIRTSN